MAAAVPYSSEDLLKIDSKLAFEDLAIKAFDYQYAENDVYKAYVDSIGFDLNINRLEQIPFLPIGFFKTHQVVSGKFEPQTVFTSSATTGSVTSKHYLKSKLFYELIFSDLYFERYPDPNHIVALLPSYLERSGSSLVYMVTKLIEKMPGDRSGFFLHNLKDLENTILELESKKEPYLLMGVTFALLDFIEERTFNLNYGTVMETGGMKGRKKELTREEVHHTLQQGFGVNQIHSEYGMTELMSQAYSKADGIFEIPKTMEVLIREVNDPFSLASTRAGGINIIDLGNIHSCCFIATQDIGRKPNASCFEVLGRFDNAELRGCNLMVV